MKSLFMLFLIGFCLLVGIQLQIREYFKLNSKNIFISTWKSNLAFGFLIISATSFVLLLDELQKEKVIDWIILQNNIVEWIIIPSVAAIFLAIVPVLYAYQVYKQSVK